MKVMKANQSWIASLKPIATLFCTEFLDRVNRIDKIMGN